MGFKNILVPVDGSRFSSRALREAIKVAKRESGRIILLGVVELPVAGFEGYQEFSVNIELEEQFSHRMKQILEQEAETLKKEGISVDTVVRTGNPADEIVSLARSEKADLVVMTTHGRRGFMRFMLGSVAEKVVRTSPCSVLVVRPSEEEQTAMEKSG
ncbi:universal stress protein [bacterium]|nr:MAG: universal stress protein [bacterium]